jgi:cell division transport system permease protein
MTYYLKATLQSLVREKWINLLSVLTIAMGLLIVSLVSVIVYNVDRATAKLPDTFSVTAYMKEDVSDAEAQQTVGVIRRNRNVENVRYISKTEALKELRKTLKDADYILEGLNEAPLPASLEIRLKRGSVQPESVKTFIADLRKMNGIEDIQYGEKLLSSIHSIRSGVRTAGIIFMVIMGAGITFICYSTVKILFYRRKEEIETLKLLGATRTFIRTPFVLEGSALGAAGGAAGLAVLFAFDVGLLRSLVSSVPLFGSVVFPTFLVPALPAAGLFLGFAGALIAIGRIRF